MDYEQTLSDIKRLSPVCSMTYLPVLPNALRLFVRFDISL